MPPLPFSLHLLLWVLVLYITFRLLMDLIYYLSLSHYTPLFRLF